MQGQVDQVQALQQELARSLAEGFTQAELDAAKSTQLPKVEMITRRVLELDDEIFFGLGPHLMAAVFYSFRAPALGGDPESGRKHFALAKQKGGVLLPDVLEAADPAHTALDAHPEAAVRPAI